MGDGDQIAHQVGFDEVGLFLQVRKKSLTSLEKNVIMK
jgi:hypothetical protein